MRKYVLMWTPERGPESPKKNERKCPVCNGTGIDSNGDTCSLCNGSGIIDD